jgi:ADP-heptose:LPS heptosyltransferase
MGDGGKLALRRWRLTGGIVSVRRIVVLRPNHRLGNMLLLTPLIQELERRFPGADIEIVAAGRAAPAVFRRYACVTAVHCFPARSFHSPGKVLLLLLRLLRRRYDLAIDPTPHSRAGRFLSGFVRARARVGYLWGTRYHDRRLTHTAHPALAPSSVALTPIHLLDSALPHTVPAGRDLQRPVLELHLTAGERDAAAVALSNMLGIQPARQQPCIAIYAHATGAKCYPPDWWHRVVAKIRVQRPSISLVEVLPEDGLPRLASDVPKFFSRDLRQLGATLAAASLVVSADCGMMHLADAAGSRVVGLFNVTNPAQYGPSGLGSAALIAVANAAESVDAVAGLIASLI